MRLIHTNADESFSGKKILKQKNIHFKEWPENFSEQRGENAPVLHGYFFRRYRARKILSIIITRQ